MFRSRRKQYIARALFGDPRSLFFITERIRATFDLDADWAVVGKTLRADPSLQHGLMRALDCACPVAGMDSNLPCAPFWASK